MDDDALQKMRVLYKAWPDLCELVGLDTVRDIVEYPDSKSSVPEGGANFDITIPIAILASSLSIVSNTISIIRQRRAERKAEITVAQIRIEIEGSIISASNIDGKDVVRLIENTIKEFDK